MDLLRDRDDRRDDVLRSGDNLSDRCTGVLVEVVLHDELLGLAHGDAGHPEHAGDGLLGAGRGRAQIRCEPHRVDCCWRDGIELQRGCEGLPLLAGASAVDGQPGVVDFGSELCEREQRCAVECSRGHLVQGRGDADRRSNRQDAVGDEPAETGRPGSAVRQALEQACARELGNRARDVGRAEDLFPTRQARLVGREAAGEDGDHVAGVDGTVCGALAGDPDDSEHQRREIVVGADQDRVDALGCSVDVVKPDAVAGGGVPAQRYGAAVVGEAEPARAADDVLVLGDGVPADRVAACPAVELREYDGLGRKVDALRKGRGRHDHADQALRGPEVVLDDAALLRAQVGAVEGDPAGQGCAQRGR